MHGTVSELVDAGEITPRKRTGVADLEWAATWLESYEGDPESDEDVLTAMATAARYLRREAARRENRSQAGASRAAGRGD